MMKTGKAEIICTGSELLEGKLNLYVPLFHERLAPLGFAIVREQSSGDSLESICDCIRCALKRAELVLVCGGLGPTFDDLTRQAAAKALGRRLGYSKTCAQILGINFGLKKLPPNFKDQCILLEGAKPLENANGTAFGQVITRGRKMLVLLPGPRKEWEPMFHDFLNAEISTFFKGLTPIRQLKLKLAGLWETQAEKLLRPVMRRFPRAAFTILAGPGTVDFILSGDDSGGMIGRAGAACRKALGAKLYGEGEDTLARAAGARLKARGETLAAAESCTGGLAAQLITDIPGSSAYFLGGAVAYANTAKMKILGVRAATLKGGGAVSAGCAREMAAGAKRVFGSDHAFSVTGIAGPGGGAGEKPAGLVYFGLAGPRGIRTFRRQFRGTRPFVRACAANFILDELRKVIK
ncbi:MAG: nicotinamide-nucleotide amidohydrolase family protein [Elusimicrobiota bacterium]|nr:nicotinamide-nucleotide amidohydrolase family protein [Elusimicrobiota bacterium]